MYTPGWLIINEPLTSTFSGQIVAQYATQQNPLGGCSDGTNVWVSNRQSGTVSKFNIVSGAMVGSYSAGSNPLAMCFDGSNVWVTNFTPATSVTKINATTGVTVGTYTVGNAPSAICFDGTSVWVCNRSDNTITKITASSGSIVGTYSVGTSPSGICWDGSHLWVAQTGDNTVSKVSTSGTTLATYSTGSGPYGVCFDGTNIWTANSVGNSVTKIVASSGSIVGTYAAGTGAQDVCFDGVHIWCVNHSAGTVTVFTASSASVVETVTTNGSSYLCCYDGQNGVWCADNTMNIVVRFAVYSGGITDQSARIHVNSGLKFSSIMRKRGTLTVGFYIAAGDSYLPTIGSPVYCWDVTSTGANQYFAGTIDEYTLSWMGTNGDQIALITAVSLEQCFDTIMLPGLLYQNQTAGYIFNDLTTRFAGSAPVQISYGVTGASIQTGATIATFTVSGWPKLSDMFDQLCKLSQFTSGNVLSGYAWGVNAATSPPTLYFQPANFGTPWQASTACSLGYEVVDQYGHIQKVTTAGTTGSSTPSWNDSGGTTTDGSVTWTDQGGGYQAPVPFIVDAPSVQWQSFDLNLSRKDYRNRQVVQLSFNAFAHSSELFSVAQQGSNPAGPNGFTLLRPVEQVTNAWYTSNTQNTATGTFSGNPSPGDTITFNFPQSGSIYNWKASVCPGSPAYYALGQIIVDPNGHIQKVTSGPGYSGTVQPTWSTTGGFVTDGPPSCESTGITWTDQGVQGFASGTLAVYQFVTALDNTQVGQVLIGATEAATIQNLVDAINALDQTNTLAGGSSTRGRGVTFSWPTWENPLVNADAYVGGSTITVRNKAAGAGYQVALTASSSAFAWNSTGVVGPSGQIITAGGATNFGTIVVPVGQAGQLSTAGLVYTPGSPYVALSIKMTGSGYLQVEYTRQDGDAIICENTSQVIARAAIEHGTGMYQQTIKDSNATNTEGLIQAQQALQAYCVIPETFTFDTLRPDIYAGQILQIGMAQPTGIAALVNGLWLVQEIGGELVLANPYIPGGNFGHMRYKVRVIDVSQIGDFITFWEGIASGGGSGSGVGETVLGSGSYGALQPAIGSGPVISCPQSSLAGLGLGAGQAGTLIVVTDYCHLMVWTGSAFLFVDGGSNYYAVDDVGSPSWGSGSAPPAGCVGWVAVDGSTVKYLKPDGTLGTKTLPNVAGGSHFLELGSGSGTFASETAGTVTGTITGGSVTVAGNVTLPSFSLSSAHADLSNVATWINAYTYTDSNSWIDVSVTGTLDTSSLDINVATIELANSYTGITTTQSNTTGISAATDSGNLSNVVDLDYTTTGVSSETGDTYVVNDGITAKIDNALHTHSITPTDPGHSHSITDQKHTHAGAGTLPVRGTANFTDGTVASGSVYGTIVTSGYPSAGTVTGSVTAGGSATWDQTSGSISSGTIAGSSSGATPPAFLAKLRFRI